MFIVDLPLNKWNYWLLGGIYLYLPQWNMFFMFHKYRHGGTYKVLRNLLKNKLVHHDATKCECMGGSFWLSNFWLVALWHNLFCCFIGSVPWFRSIQMMDIGSPILDMTSLPSRLWLIEEFLLRLAVRSVLERSQVCHTLNVYSLF